VYVIDANVWVSRWLKADEFHEPSYKWLFSLVEDRTPFAAPVLILPEISGAVARRSRSPKAGMQASSLIQAMPGIQLVSMDASFARAAAGIASSLGIRGAEAVYVALAKAIGYTLVTWDNEVLARSNQVCRVSTPQAELQKL